MAMSNAFTDLRNSSTRCEIAASMIAMANDKLVNIGCDSMATIRKGMGIIKHVADKAKTAIYTEEGEMLLGELQSPLRRTRADKKNGSSRKTETFGKSFRGSSNSEGQTQSLSRK